jgi:ectoine hydroxylase-related dioxygenase (phytanoyl-CoA dioxygenase family)
MRPLASCTVCESKTDAARANAMHCCACIDALVRFDPTHVRPGLAIDDATVENGCTHAISAAAHTRAQMFPCALKSDRAAALFLSQQVCG